MKGKKVENKRNMVRQEIILTDKEGNITGMKAVFHQKKTHHSNHKTFWDALNTNPKKNSKRQQLLRAAKAA